MILFPQRFLRKDDCNTLEGNKIELLERKENAGWKLSPIVSLTVPSLNKMNVATIPNIHRKTYVPSLMYHGNHWNNRVVKQVSEWFLKMEEESFPSIISIITKLWLSICSFYLWGRVHSQLILLMIIRVSRHWPSGTGDVSIGKLTKLAISRNFKTAFFPE